MKVVRSGSTSTYTISTCMLVVSNTADMEPPPSDHLSGNAPVLMSHPRINYRSAENTSHCVRASLFCIFYVIHLYCYYFRVFIVSSPLSYCPVVPTTAADAPLIDYIDDDRTPTIELPGKQSHSPLPHIAYFSIIICCTRHMLLLRYFPIQMHSLSLSPFDVPFLYPIAAFIIYIIYTTVDPALC